MTITLNTQVIVGKMKAISHREVSEIADVEARYRAEAGTEKTNEINASIKEAASRLMSRLGRWMRLSLSGQGSNASLSLPATYVYELDLSERRAVNTAEPLTSAMETFVIEYALAKFYSAVSQVELSNKHSILALDAGKEVDNMLYTKKPPIV